MAFADNAETTETTKPQPKEQDPNIKEAFDQAAKELNLFIKHQGSYIVIDKECSPETQKELELQASECAALDAKAKEKEAEDKKKTEKEIKKEENKEYFDEYGQLI